MNHSGDSRDKNGKRVEGGPERFAPHGGKELDGLHQDTRVDKVGR